MISFHYETNFSLEYGDRISEWISDAIIEENCHEGEITYIFCTDAYLHKLNLEFLKHDTFTDIISFDYSVGKELHGDVYISVERVRENADDFQVLFEDELARVMIHGVLHYCGYNDKTETQKELMRSKENYYLAKRS